MRSSIGNPKKRKKGERRRRWKKRDSLNVSTLLLSQSRPLIAIDDLSECILDDLSECVLKESGIWNFVTNNIY
jgi:hypothetical protein